MISHRDGRHDATVHRLMSYRDIGMRDLSEMKSALCRKREKLWKIDGKVQHPSTIKNVYDVERMICKGDHMTR